MCFKLSQRTGHGDLVSVHIQYAFTMFLSNFSQFLPQICIICLSIGHQLTELDLSHLEESEEEVHEGAGAGPAWVEFVD